MLPNLLSMPLSGMPMQLPGMYIRQDRQVHATRLPCMLHTGQSSLIPARCLKSFLMRPAFAHTFCE